VIFSLLESPYLSELIEQLCSVSVQLKLRIIKPKKYIDVPHYSTRID